MSLRQMVSGKKAEPLRQLVSAIDKFQTRLNKHLQQQKGQKAKLPHGPYKVRRTWGQGESLNCISGWAMQ